MVFVTLSGGTAKGCCLCAVRTNTRSNAGRKGGERTTGQTNDDNFLDFHCLNEVPLESSTDFVFGLEFTAVVAGVM